MCVLKSVRERQADLQNWHCYYCRQPMWRCDPRPFATRYGISLRQAVYLQATAEHLQPKSKGGSNSAKNIVAACYFCNSRRHFARQPLTPNDYASKVRKKLIRGKWHGLRLRPLDD